jgi:hypothetical protein
MTVSTSRGLEWAAADLAMQVRWVFCMTDVPVFVELAFNFIAFPTTRFRANPRLRLASFYAVVDCLDILIHS